MALFGRHRYPFKSVWKWFLVACLDVIGSLFSLPFKAFRKPLDPASVQKILVIRVDHIGDVVMTRPAIRAMHKKFPHASIDLAVDEAIAPLFSNSKEIRTVIPVRHSWFSRRATWSQKWAAFVNLASILRGKYYDLGIDFRGDLRNSLLMWWAGVRYRVGSGRTGGGFLLNEDIVYDPALHQVLLNLRLLNSFHIAQDNKLLPFEYTPEKAKEFWETIGQVSRTTVLPRVVVHIEAGYSSKRWPFENFRALLQKIDQAALAQIVVIGTESEREKGPDFKIDSERFVDMRGKTSLQDLPILFDACDIFIGNDSGPSHIAAAQGLEIILLASGTNDMRYWYPWTERLSILQHEVPCAPCEIPVCPVDSHPCMEMITVDQVFDAFQSVLRRLQEKA